MKEARENQITSGVKVEYIYLDWVNTSLIRQNWELCMHRLVHYYKTKYVDEDSFDQLDEDMIRWVYKLSQIVTGLNSFPKGRKIVSKEDDMLLNRLFEVIKVNTNK